VTRWGAEIVIGGNAKFGIRSAECRRMTTRRTASVSWLVEGGVATKFRRLAIVWLGNRKLRKRKPKGSSRPLEWPVRPSWIHLRIIRIADVAKSSVAIFGLSISI